MSEAHPAVVILAGPNGAGKTTASPHLLRDTLGVTEFVNADIIARGLSAFDPESVAMAAGRIMLQRMDELARQRRSFGFETTLASRTFAPWLERRRAQGYEVYVAFLWLPSPELAIERVAGRVALGGHHVPDDVVRRRYAGGLRNFFQLYRPLATKWTMRNGADPEFPRLIASGRRHLTSRVGDPGVWDRIVREWEQP